MFLNYLLRPLSVTSKFSRTFNHENNPSYLPDMVFITIVDFNSTFRSFLSLLYFLTIIDYNYFI